MVNVNNINEVLFILDKIENHFNFYISLILFLLIGYAIIKCTKFIYTKIKSYRKVLKDNDRSTSSSNS